MNRILIIAGITTTLALSASVVASRDYCYVPMSQWKPRAEAVLWAESQGWVVHRIKIDDGCYELYGLEENGLEFEAKVNPSTFEIINFEYESHGYSNRIRATDSTVEHVTIEGENGDD